MERPEIACYEVSANQAGLSTAEPEVQAFQMVDNDFIVMIVQHIHCVIQEMVEASMAIPSEML